MNKETGDYERQESDGREDQWALGYQETLERSRFVLYVAEPIFYFTTLFVLSSLSEICCEAM